MPAIAAAPWSDIYRRCRAIHDMGDSLRTLLRAWEPAASFRARCGAYRQSGIAVPTDIEDDLIAIRERLRTEVPNPHYQDVFHAATYILVIPLVTYTPRVLVSEDPSPHPYVHRGQRNFDWLVAPNILRPDRGSTFAVTPELARARLRRTGAFVQRLCALRPDLDEAHATAIAQHYSNAAKVHTWLIDMTSDPFVALWFASLGGEAGQVGIVESIHLPDWNEIADIPGRPLGPAKLLYPPGVPRLKAQHGLFLEAPSGVFWPQYHKQSLTFWQHAGRVFEDPAIGVTAALLMPEDDELRRCAEAFAQERSPLDAELANEAQLLDQLFVDFTVAAPYYSLARHVASEWHPVIPAALDAQLCRLAWFHGTLLLPPWTAALMKSGQWSIRRFVQAVGYAALNELNHNTEPWEMIIERAMFDITAVRNEVRAAVTASERRYVACP